MTKEDVQKRVLKNGNPLNLDLFEWDEKTNTFSSAENGLVLDFADTSYCNFTTGNYCTFNTGDDCTFNSDNYCVFKTGHDCTFTTGIYCTFTTGIYCVFKTGHDCTFNSDDYCVFKTGHSCTFKIGYNCTFNTGDGCTFNSDNYCVFKTGHDCTFITGIYCTFTTGSSCTFTTGSNCIFTTGSGCTFNSDNYCVFKTEYNCIFNTGIYCTFKTGNSCDFNTGSCCTFDTRWFCTFETGNECVIIRRDIFEIITPKEGEAIKTCPVDIKGFISKTKDENDFHMETNGVRVPHIIVDGILSKVINKKGNVYKVINYGEENESYIITDGFEKWAHGDTLKEAKKDLLFKLSKKDLTKYNDININTEYKVEFLIQMYHDITGACSSGIRYFVDNLKLDLDKKYNVKNVIDLVCNNNSYGNVEFKKYFEK